MVEHYREWLFRLEIFVHFPWILPALSNAAGCFILGGLLEFVGRVISNGSKTSKTRRKEINPAAPRGKKRIFLFLIVKELFSDVRCHPRPGDQGEIQIPAPNLSNQRRGLLDENFGIDEVGFDKSCPFHWPKYVRVIIRIVRIYSSTNFVAITFHALGVTLNFQKTNRSRFESKDYHQIFIQVLSSACKKKNNSLWRCEQFQK